MRHIDEDTITQAVIAAHAGAGDSRLRDVMTCLVQHLHAFAREVRLTEDEWAAGLAFLSASARVDRVTERPRDELALLSDTLGLTSLVTSLNQRKPRGCTEATRPRRTSGAAVERASVDGATHAPGLPTAASTGVSTSGSTSGQSLFVRGRVSALHGGPLAGATLCFSQGQAVGATVRTDVMGRYLVHTTLAEPQAVPHDGPVGELLRHLGRAPWRPAHLHVGITADGHEGLETQLFRAGSRHLDADATFAVRRSLVLPWVLHEQGIAPDGSTGESFYTVDFDVVLNPVPELMRA
jgi:hydroxyquinol 1,2-dioxygenase